MLHQVYRSEFDLLFHHPSVAAFPRATIGPAEDPDQGYSSDHHGQADQHVDDAQDPSTYEFASDTEMNIARHG